MKKIALTLALACLTLSSAKANDTSKEEPTCAPYLRAEDKKTCEKMSRPKAEKDIPAKICTWHPEAEDKCECCIYN